MAYTDGDSLGVRIRIAFGASIAADPATWVWTDVTAWWYIDDDVTIGWGRSSGAEQPETSTFSATLKNTDGRFTAYDARSPYWPHVRKWTPISYDIDLGDGAGWRNRFSGLIRKWPLTWPGASALMALAKIDAVGVLGRLGRGNPPSRSAMRRTIPASGALAYWPVEDGGDAGQVASAYAGHAPLAITGVVEFRDIDPWTESRGYEVKYGTAALVDISAGGALAAAVPADVTAATASSAGWTVAVAADVAMSALASDLVLLEVRTPGGTYTTWRLVISASGGTQIIASNAAGSVVVVNDPTTFQGMYPYNFAVWSSGGSITAGWGWDSVSGWRGTGSVAGSVGGVSRVAVNPTGSTAAEPEPAGHIAVWAGHELDQVDIRDGAFALALFGYAWTGLPVGIPTGESATARLARLTAEDGVSLDIPAVDASAEVFMGRQQPGKPLDLYQECETADQGLIYESGFGLGYLPRDARYNAPVALTIDGAARQLTMPFEPVDDDQGLRNLWTVERTGGSSAVAADKESIDLQGEIEGSATVNLASDGPLADHAGHRLRQSTVQEPRYPAVGINLAAHPELAAAWCACKPGSRINVVNPPEQNVPGTVDQLVVGATETYRGRRSWKATLNVVPASPWQVATVGGEPRVAADGSTVAVDLGTESPDPVNADPYLTAGDLAAWTPSNATVVRSTTTTHDGYASLQITANGGVSGGANASALAPIDTAATWRASLWAWSATATTVGPAVDWHNAAGGYITTSFVGPTAIPAGTWTLVTGTFTPPVGATQAKMRARHDAATPAGRVWHATQIVLARVVTVQLASTATNGVWTTNPADFPLDIRVGGEQVTVSAITGTTSPQPATVSARAVNGVTRAWPAGTEVDVWDPAIVSL